MSVVSQSDYEVFLRMSNPSATKCAAEYAPRAAPTIGEDVVVADALRAKHEGEHDGGEAAENEDSEGDDGDDPYDEEEEGGEEAEEEEEEEEDEEEEEEEEEEKEGAEEEEFGANDVAVATANDPRRVPPNVRTLPPHNQASEDLQKRPPSVTSHPSPDSPMSMYSSAPRRAKLSAEETLAEQMEKQAILTDLERMSEHAGVILSRKWTMADSLDDLSFEARRLTVQIDEANNVGMMRNGLQFACTGLEMASRRFGILNLDGWSSEVCSDMSRYDRSLGRMYRKYWRRSHMSSPEADIALSIMGSMALFHMRKTVSKQMFSRAPNAAPFMDPNPLQGMFGNHFRQDFVDDDEAPPPTE